MLNKGRWRRKRRTVVVGGLGCSHGAAMVVGVGVVKALKLME